MLKNIKKFITDNKRDLTYILLLVGLLLIIAIPRLLTQYNISIANWDTYLYLENGRNFAKMGWGDVPSIAPVLPMIISKFFLLAGHTYPEIIFNIDVVFYIVGAVSLYMILRYKFSQSVSLVGSFIFATFTLLYSWVSIGGNDIIGVTGTLLTIYLVLLANKHDNRFYLLAFPIAAYAFLSRYTAGVMLFAIIFLILVNRIDKDRIKYIICGLILGLLSVSWFLNHFYITLGTAFPFLGQFSGTVSNTPVMDSGYLPDVWYYIIHLPNYLSSIVPNNKLNNIINPMGNTPTILSYIFIILFIIGLMIIIANIIKSVKSSEIVFSTKRNKFILTVAILLGLVCAITINNVSYIITIILFMIVLLLLYHILREYNIEYLDYEFMMILLLFTYIVFQSILSTKNDRYFITALPFIAYFITCSIDKIYDYINKKIEFKGNIKLSAIISTAVIVLLVASSLSYNNDIPTDNHYDDIEEACNWLKEYDDTINNSTVIYSDNWPAVTWYYNIYAQRGVPNTNNSSSIWSFSNFILSQNGTHHAATYYINTNTKDKPDYPGLTKIYEKGDVVIYENSYKLGVKPKIVESDEYKMYINKTLTEAKGGVNSYV